MINADLLVQARAALARGDRSTARALVTQIVRAPGGASNGEAWWLLAQTLDDPAQKEDCNKRALAAGYREPVATQLSESQSDLLSWLAEAASAPPAQQPAERSTHSLHPDPAPLPAAGLQMPLREFIAPDPAQPDVKPPAPSQPDLKASNSPSPDGRDSTHTPSGAPSFVSSAPPPAQQQGSAELQPDFASLFTSASTAEDGPAQAIELPSLVNPEQARIPIALEPPPAEGQGPYSPADIALVVDLLGQQASHNELLREVIKHRNCTVQEAERLVRHVQEHHRGKVAAKQLPLILMVCFVMLITGLVALGNVAMTVSRDSFEISRALLNRVFLASIVMGPLLTLGALIGAARALRATRKK